MNGADVLALAGDQLHLTAERLQRTGVTVNDLREFNRYLDALADHGQALCFRFLRAIDETEENHPVRTVPHGTDLQADLDHARSLLNAVMHFALEAQRSLTALTQGDPS